MNNPRVPAIRRGGGMGIKGWIIPQERAFFDMLSETAAVVADGAALLSDLLHDFRDVPEKRRRIKDAEHRADYIVHSIHEALNRTFITPIDREDIQGLASTLDNVLDMIDAAATRILLYEIEQPVDAMVRLGDVIVQATVHLRTAVGMIRNMKTAGEVEKIALEVHRLENAADDILNSAVAKLFHENGNDPVYIIKYKDIIERLEESTDYCEDVANILSDIVAKNR